MNDWRRFSRLPDSHEYWQQLATRMQRSVQGIEAEEPVRSLAPLAWTAIAAAAAAVIASTMLPPAGSAAISLRSGLAPTDPLAVSWLDSARPPTAAELLFIQATRAR